MCPGEVDALIKSALATLGMDATYLHIPRGDMHDSTKDLPPRIAMPLAKTWASGWTTPYRMHAPGITPCCARCGGV